MSTPVYKKYKSVHNTKNCIYNLILEDMLYLLYSEIIFKSPNVQRFPCKTILSGIFVRKSSPTLLPIIHMSLQSTEQLKNEPTPRFDS